MAGEIRKALAEDSARRVAEFGGKKAFMFVPGIDVPFHSTLLRKGVPEFRDKLDALLPAHIDYRGALETVTLRRENSGSLSVLAPRFASVGALPRPTSTYSSTPRPPCVAAESTTRNEEGTTRSAQTTAADGGAQGATQSGAAQGAAQGVAGSDVADIPFKAHDAIATLLAYAAKIRPEQIGGQDTTDTLTNGVSSRRNQLLMDISSERGRRLCATGSAFLVTGSAFCGDTPGICRVLGTLTTTRSRRSTTRNRGGGGRRRGRRRFGHD